MTPRRTARVIEVRGGSPCEGMVKEGDLLLKINGSYPLDILDYLAANLKKKISLRLSREGRERAIKVRKEAGVPLGLVFEDVVFDGLRTCRNRCIFCFVDQMPRGLRPSLYVKDDDYRLSFYYGNFITLNNLLKADLERIIRLRISPLYVSLHTTDASLRDYMMGGNAAKGLEALYELIRQGIEIHLQVVVCPGINDGGNLRRTLLDVLDNYAGSSLGLVPLGMTRAASSLNGDLKAHDRWSSLEVLEILDEYQQMALDRKGERIFYAADEFYIMAGLQFPAAEEYGEYPQLENGVGMARKFIDEAARALQALQSDAKGEKGKTMKKGVLTGEAGARVIGPILDRYYSGKEIEVVVAKNILFGDSISVTGLLGGDDIITALKEHAPCSSELLIPKNLLREGCFIDDLNLDDVRGKTGINLIPVEVNGEALARSLTP